MTINLELFQGTRKLQPFINCLPGWAAGNFEGNCHEVWADRNILIKNIFSGSKNTQSIRSRPFDILKRPTWKKSKSKKRLQEKRLRKDLKSTLVISFPQFPRNSCISVLPAHPPIIHPRRNPEQLCSRENAFRNQSMNKYVIPEHPSRQEQLWGLTVSWGIEVRIERIFQPRKPIGSVPSAIALTLRRDVMYSRRLSRDRRRWRNKICELLERIKWG